MSTSWEEENKNSCDAHALHITKITMAVHSLTLLLHETLTFTGTVYRSQT